MNDEELITKVTNTLISVRGMTHLILSDETFAELRAEAREMIAVYYVLREAGV